MKSINLLQNPSHYTLDASVRKSITTFKLSEYITWLELKVQPDEAIKIKINEPDNMALYFLYNLGAKINITNKGDECEEQLEKFQSAFVHESQGKESYLHLKPQKNYQIYIAQVSKYNDEKELNDFFPHFEKAMEDLDMTHYFLHTGLPNLELGEYVKVIIDMPKEELSDKLMASGYINIIVSLKLKQLINYHQNPPQNTQLTQWEIEKVKEVSDTIIKAPENSYSIDEICKQWGLNANKLQMGFREMHNRTVCSFINHQRLLKAEKLLKSTDMNVSQIVYSLGWSSRSYFCKIFKEKYQCSPKKYKAQLMSF